MNNTLKLLISGCMILVAGTLQAQVFPPPPPGGAPVDGGVGLLVAAGAIYGAKKLRDSRRRQRENAESGDQIQS